MFTIYEIAKDYIYIAFPVRLGEMMVDRVPPEIRKWADDTLENPRWGIVQDVKVGLFLSNEDVTLFKLKFL